MPGKIAGRSHTRHLKIEIKNSTMQRRHRWQRGEAGWGYPYPNRSGTTPHKLNEIFGVVFFCYDAAKKFFNAGKKIFQMWKFV